MIKEINAMKKQEMDLSKFYASFCLLGLLALGFMTTVATGGGGGGDGGNVGNAPKINNVLLFDVNDANTSTLNFDIGDQINFHVYATDPDLDIITIHITQYHPPNSDIPCYGPDSIATPSQPSSDYVLYPITPLEITGPAGNWRTEFQLEDANGNDSNVFIVYSVVH